MVFHFFEVVPDHTLANINTHHHHTETCFLQTHNQPYFVYFDVNDPAFKAKVEFDRAGPLFPAATDKQEISGPFKFGFLKHMDATRRIHQELTDQVFGRENMETMQVRLFFTE